VRLDAGTPGVFVRDWPVISTTPEKHRAYAVQWFAMAAMLLALHLYYSTRRDSQWDPSSGPTSGHDHHG